MRACGVREPCSRFGWAKRCCASRMAARRASASMAGARHKRVPTVHALAHWAHGQPFRHGGTGAGPFSFRLSALPTLGARASRPLRKRPRWPRSQENRTRFFSVAERSFFPLCEQSVVGCPVRACGVREPCSRFGWATPCCASRMAARSDSASRAGALHKHGPTVYALAHWAHGQPFRNGEILAEAGQLHDPAPRESELDV